MNNDRYLAFVVLFQMIVVTIQLLLPLLGIMDTENAARCRIYITLITYTPGIIILLKRKWKLLAITFLVYFIFLVMNYAFFPDSQKFLEMGQAYTLTPISLLSVLFMIEIRNFTAFIKVLLWISRVSVIISLMYVWAYNYSPFRNVDELYSMSFGYSMLLPAMYLFSKDNTLDKVFSFILFMLILLAGSRGPIAVLCMYYMIDILVINKIKDKLRLIILTILVGTVSILVLPKIIDMESSRTIYLLSQGEFVSHDSGREEDMYSKIRPHLYDSPFFGHGIGADRHFLNGSYAHNIFYEVFIHYGLAFGGILLLSFFMWLIRLHKSIRTKKCLGGRSLFIMMFLYGFVPLLVSNSYLIAFSFSIMMGYYLKINMLFKLKTVLYR